jgi:serine protease Do
MANFPLNVAQRPSGELIDLSGHLDLRRSVFPLVFAENEGHFRWHGTCFGVSFAGQFVTAMHVINDVLGSRGEALREQGSLGVIFIPGIAYGRLAARPFRLFDQAEVFPGDPNPLDYSSEPDFSRPKLDLASFFPRLEPGDYLSPLWVRTARAVQSRPGDRVLAVGFNQATGVPGDNAAAVNYTDCLSGSWLTVTEMARRNPEGSMGGGPILVFDANIPGGFSGGPIFAEDGAVIGVVSTGMKEASFGTAVALEPLPANRTLFPGQCHDNPDWFRGWAVCGPGSNTPLELHWEKRDAERSASGIPEAQVRQVVRPRSRPDDYIYA